MGLTPQVLYLVNSYSIGEIVSRHVRQGMLHSVIAVEVRRPNGIIAYVCYVNFQLMSINRQESWCKSTSKSYNIIHRKLNGLYTQYNRTQHVAAVFVLFMTVNDLK